MSQFYNPKCIYHIFSDFCLEEFDQVPVLIPNRTKNSHTICILAGNIGHPKNANYWDLLDQCNRYFDTTLVIMGEFECKGSTISYTSDFLTSEIEKKFRNIFFLNNEGCKLRDGTIAIGSPHWSSKSYFPSIGGFTSNVARSAERVSSNVIKEGLRLASINGTNDIENKPKLLFITSCPPVFSEKELFNWPKSIWIHGTNGLNGSKFVNKVQLLSNQFTFFGDKHRSFNPNFAFVL